MSVTKPVCPWRVSINRPNPSLNQGSGVACSVYIADCSRMSASWAVHVNCLWLAASVRLTCATLLVAVKQGLAVVNGVAVIVRCILSLAAGGISRFIVVVDSEMSVTLAQLSILVPSRSDSLGVDTETNRTT